MIKQFGNYCRKDFAKAYQKFENDRLLERITKYTSTLNSGKGSWFTAQELENMRETHRQNSWKIRCKNKKV